MNIEGSWRFNNACTVDYFGEAVGNMTDWDWVPVPSHDR